MPLVFRFGIAVGIIDLLCRGQLQPFHGQHLPSLPHAVLKEANAKAQEAIAKALEQNGQVALAMAIIDKLPEISASYAQAVASIDQLTVFDGAAGVSGQTNEGLAQSLAFIKDATGIDVAELVNKRADGTTTLNRPVPVEENK